MSKIPRDRRDPPDGTEKSTDGRHHPLAAVADADAHWMFGIDAVSDEALSDLTRALRANSSSR
jgi:hypothetical protein